MQTPGKYVLALDQGTTSSRTLVLDQGGKVVGKAQREFHQFFPDDGWVEHDAKEIWETQRATMEEAMAQLGIGPGQVAAIGITNQRETTVVWNRANGQPVCPAIVWQDRRTADECRRMREEGREPWIAAKTGKRLDPYFSVTKLRWILEHVPDARSRAEAGELCFGTIDSWLLWNLTGGQVHATDASNASRTLLCDLETGAWDDALLDYFGIPRALLPELRSCSEIYGETAAGIPIAGMAGDQSAALFGQACFRPGMVKNTYGTGCFMLMHTGTEAVHSQNHLLTTVAWKIGDKTEYALEGSVFNAGSVVKWLRDELGLIRESAECDRLASEVANSAGTCLVPAFTGLGAPHWDPYARALWIGMTRGTNKRHLCRAALESIAYQSAELLRAMEKDSGLKLQELRVDGGGAQSAVLLQFQADLLQIPVTRPQVVESTARGAAFLAGLAVGFWRDRDEIEAQWQPEYQFSPRRTRDEMTAGTRQWERAVERAKNWEEAK